LSKFIKNIVISSRNWVDQPDSECVFSDKDGFDAVIQSIISNLKEEGKEAYIKIWVEMAPAPMPGCVCIVEIKSDFTLGEYVQYGNMYDEYKSGRWPDDPSNLILLFKIIAQGMLAEIKLFLPVM
jgi:hypothetical protein